MQKGEDLIGIMRLPGSPENVVEPEVVSRELEKFVARHRLAGGGLARARLVRQAFDENLLRPKGEKGCRKQRRHIR